MSDNAIAEKGYRYRYRYRSLLPLFFIFLIIICICRIFLLILHKKNNTNHKHNYYHYEVHDKESSCHGLQPQPQLQWCYAHTEQMDWQMRCAEETTLSARLHKLITKPYSRTGEPHLRVSWRAVIIERIWKVNWFRTRSTFSGKESTRSGKTVNLFRGHSQRF